MAANAQELALRYLLALSSDIRSAALLTEDGELLASAPAAIGDPALADARALVTAGLSFRNGRPGEAVEIDILCARDSVYVLADEGVAMVCVADRLALPGIVLHEMRTVLGDIKGGGGSGTTLRSERA